MTSDRTQRSGFDHGLTRLRAAAATVLLAAALPLSAQPFTRTIAAGETVVVNRSSVFAVPANESLLIELGGELQGRGSVIGLAGRVQNNGNLRAYKGSENSTAVAVSGPLNSSLTGLIEVTSLWVQAGGAVNSAGGFVVGGFRINPSDPLTTVCAFDVPCPGTGFEIEAGGAITVASGSPMLNYGNAQISGTLDNRGFFVSRNSTNTNATPPDRPYTQVLTVGKDPDFGVGSGQVLNSGSFELQRGNTLRNFSGVFNSGSLLLNGGKLDVLGTGRLGNTGNIQVGAGGQLVVNSLLVDNLGNRLPSLFSTGNITVADGELVNRSLIHLVASGNAPAVLSVGKLGTVSQGEGYGELLLQGGELLVEGSYHGDSITVDNMGTQLGVVSIEKDAEMRLDGRIRQINGILKVDGELWAPVRLEGGDLRGTGRVNGSVFVRGLGGGPRQEPPNCGNTFYACFRPGNSPGHMDISGELTMGDNSILELEIERDASGVLAWDSVFADTMSFEFGSSIVVRIGAGVPGSALVDLDLLQCGTLCNWDGAQFEVVGGAGGEFTLGANGLSFALAPVPEPGTWALWMIGLAALVGFRTQRRQVLHRGADGSA
jgi:PEP-CTERM motif